VVGAIRLVAEDHDGAGEEEGKAPLGRRPGEEARPGFRPEGQVGDGVGRKLVHQPPARLQVRRVGGRPVPGYHVRAGGLRARGELGATVPDIPVINSFIGTLQLEEVEAREVAGLVAQLEVGQALRARAVLKVSGVT
jgi:hypothetical protein